MTSLYAPTHHLLPKLYCYRLSLLLAALLCTWALADTSEQLYHDALKAYGAADYEKTAAYLKKIIKQKPQDDLAEQVLLWQGECLLRLNKANKARKTLGRFLKKYPRSVWLSRARYWYALALARTNDEFDAMLHLGKVVETADNPILDSLAVQSLEAYVSTKATLAEMHEMEGLLRASPTLVALLRYYRALRFYKAGNYAEACELFDSFLSAFPQHAYAATAGRYANVARKKSASMFRVALMVPLSGEYKPTGLSVVRASELVFRQFNQTHLQQIYWKTIDTRGEPIHAVLAVQKLLREAKAQVVVGPVLTDEAIAVGAAVGNNYLPVITPTATGEKITAVSPSLYQVPVTPKMISRKLASYAVKVLNIGEFVIIAPLTEYGRIMSNGFEQAVTELGAQCTMTHYYPEGETNFRRIFTRIRNRKFVEEECPHLLDSVDLKQDTLPFLPKTTDDDSTEVYVGGLFLPCNPNEVIALASQARHYLVRGQLLGTSAWYSTEIASQNTKAVEGAIICVDFLPEANPREWEKFGKLFEQRYRILPDKVAGQAYDTAQLLCTILRNMRTKVSGREIAYQLRSIANYQGISGKISFDPETHTNREVVVLRILQGSFVRVQ